MDRPEIIANKGYETFGEHFMKKGESNAISVFEKLGVSPEKIAEAKAMLAEGDSVDKIIRVTKLPKQEVVKLKRQAAKELATA